MAYNKTIWNTGDVVTAEKLNNLENGVANAIPRITLTYSEELTSAVSSQFPPEAEAAAYTVEGLSPEDFDFDHIHPAYLIYVEDVALYAYFLYEFEREADSGNCLLTLYRNNITIGSNSSQLEQNYVRITHNPNGLPGYEDVNTVCLIMEDPYVIIPYPNDGGDENELS